MSAHILIADDDRELAEAVAWYLQAEGFRVTVAVEAAQALAAMVEDPPHAAILDIAVAGADGFDRVRRLRAAAATPILMLGASETEVERARTLGLADAYMAKHLGPLELVGHFRALLGRSGAQFQTGRLTPGLEVRLDEQRALVEGETAPLTELEFKLLVTLMGQPRTPLTRSQIADALWGDDHYGNLQLVDGHVSHLRRKLRQAGLRSMPLVTVWGVGYAYRPVE